MLRLMELMPATSTTVGIMVMSAVPTYADTSPPATVDAMTFGTPIGSPRMARVAMEVPPLPAMPRMPPNRPAPCRSLTTLASPAAMVSIASVLSSLARSSAMLLPPARATSSAVTSGRKGGSPSTPKSTTMVSSPRAAIRSRTKRNSSPLVSRAPTITTGFGIDDLLVRHGVCRNGWGRWLEYSIGDAARIGSTRDGAV